MIHRIARTGMCAAILLLATAFKASALAGFPTISGSSPNSTARWSTGEGVTSFRFDPDLLSELQISIQGPARKPSSQMPGDLAFPIVPDTWLDVWAPRAAWDGFADGAISHSGRLRLEWPDGRFETDGFTLRPTEPDALELIDDAGNPLFRLDYIHTMLYPDERRMTLWNMDVSLTPWLADRMGYPDMAGLVIAGGFTRTDLYIPAGAETDGAACAVPNWHDGVDFVTDVELSNLGGVQQVAREAGVRVAIAPSATLRNVGTADVPWYEKFTTEPPAEFSDYPEPYSRDQHPFLVWAMYRVVDDIPQQIGQSAVKHAFFSQNSGCDCAGGHILWSADSTGNQVGCGDTYGISTNDRPQHLGVRAEIPAFTGAWEQCGSMFALDEDAPGPCNSTYDGVTEDSFERRLVVEESALGTPDATYYFEAWYLIRDDVDIFNTMAHKSVDPTFGSSWSFPPTSVHTLGPAIDEWVPPNTAEAMQAHAVEVTNNGHYSLAVKVTDLGGGMYRYVYALMNYDFDPKFNSLSLDVPSDVSVNNIQFLDGDSEAPNDWASSLQDDALTWTAPAGAALEWGHMVTFVFEADHAPVATVVRLSADEAPIGLSPLVLGLTDTFQRNGFED